MLAISYVNDLLSTGVTPDNNALVALSKSLAYEGGYSTPDYPLFVDALGVTDIRPVHLFVEPDEYLDKTYPTGNDVEQAKRNDEFIRVIEEPWTTKQFPQWAEAIQNQNEALDSVVQATRLPRYFHPLISGNDDTSESLMDALLPLAHTIRRAARALSVRAMNRLGEIDQSRQRINRLERGHD